jgi:RES domain-containing protein
MSSVVRDQALLDALESLEQRPFSEVVWRSVRVGHRADLCARSGGRWDDRSFDVLYTSLTRTGAIEERRFHLYRGQPIVPSKVHYEICSIRVSLEAVIKFESLSELESVGLKTRMYGAASYSERNAEYPRSQEIAEAAYFLGADGIIVPNAREDNSLNLVVFCEQEPMPEIGEPQSLGLIDWSKK